MRVEHKYIHSGFYQVLQWISVAWRRGTGPTNWRVLCRVAAKSCNTRAWASTIALVGWLLQPKSTLVLDFRLILPTVYFIGQPALPLCDQTVCCTRLCETELSGDQTEWHCTSTTLGAIPTVWHLLMPKLLVSEQTRWRWRLATKLQSHCSNSSFHWICRSQAIRD